MYSGIPLKCSTSNTWQKTPRERHSVTRISAPHQKVVRTVGPRGGFKYLSYEYVMKDGVRHVSTTFKSDAEQLMELLESYGVPVSDQKL